jgi:hypothetical protein
MTTLSYQILNQTSYMPKYKQKVVIKNLEVILSKGGKHLKEQ